MESREELPRKLMDHEDLVRLHRCRLLRNVGGTKGGQHIGDGDPRVGLLAAQRQLQKAIAEQIEFMLCQALLMGDEMVWIDKCLYILSFDHEMQWIDVARIARERTRNGSTSRYELYWPHH